MNQEWAFWSALVKIYHNAIENLRGLSGIFFYQVFIGINLVFLRFSCVSAKNFNKHTRQQIWETVLQMKY